MSSGSEHSVESEYRCVTVAEVVSSRYPSHTRPENWDDRHSGIDTVRTTEGKVVRLLSDGQQSPPLPGWSILLRSGDNSEGYLWTLYGIPQGCKVRSA